MLFGRQSALRRSYPMARVDYIRVEGGDWVPDPEKRYQTVEMLGSLPLLVPRIIALVLDDVPKTFRLAQDGVHRTELPVIPTAVVREAVVNAVMHRSYAKVEGQAACCSPVATSTTSPMSGSGGCCSTDAAPAMHEELTAILSRFNVNEFAASTEVYAVKPR